MATFKSCMAENIKNMPTRKIKNCINKLMFKPEKFQKDKELMTLVILKEKADKLKFLEGFTKWKAVGTWRDVSPTGKIIKEYPDEKNLVLEIEYRDSKEKVSPRLQKLFNELNKGIIKERVLYTRFSNIEHSSLT